MAQRSGWTRRLAPSYLTNWPYATSLWSIWSLLLAWRYDRYCNRMMIILRSKDTETHLLWILVWLTQRGLWGTLVVLLLVTEHAGAHLEAHRVEAGPLNLRGAVPAMLPFSTIKSKTKYNLRRNQLPRSGQDVGIMGEPSALPHDATVLWSLWIAASKSLGQDLLPPVDDPALFLEGGRGYD